MITTVLFSEIAKVLGAELHGSDGSFLQISIDTRTLEPGQLYVALQGKNFDGNEFVSKAAENNASGAVVSRLIDCPLPQLLVKDTTKALGDIARWHRQALTTKVIAITGSQGKTTVKEMTGSILKVRHQALVTKGNLNNAIGVPLTLLQLKETDEYAVIELGASAAGEIAYTVQLAQPQVAVLTNAAAAHLEGFGSIAGVVAAKGEIIDGVAKQNGVAVLNADETNLAVWQKRAGNCRTVTFSVKGAESHADYYADDIQLETALGSRFRMHTPQGEVRITLQVGGLHNIANALAAAAASLEAGASLADVSAGLAGTKAVNGRLRLLPGFRQANLIDDSYNASPGSFRAAIDVLANCEGTRVLIVGDMAELGHETESAHRDVGEYARKSGIDALWSVGEYSKLSAISFGDKSMHFENHDELVRFARSQLTATTTALIKGSRSSRMDVIVAQLSNGEPH